MTGTKDGGANRPLALFVLGEARSGSSAIARALSLCGGYWEPRAAKVVNEKILRRKRSGGFDPTLRLQEEGAFGLKDRTARIAEIGALLTALPNAPFVIISDPRVSLLAGLWFEAARVTGFDVATVIGVRDPSEVIPTVAAQGGPMPELASAVWLKINLLAEADTRAVPRVFVEYANLVEDWRREVERISLTLGVDLNTRDEGAIEKFLRPKLRLQQHDGSMANIAEAERISVVYDAMSAAARDQPLDQPALERAFAAYRASERGFRPIFDGFQRLDKMSKHFRPTMMGMIDKARATASRRREN